MPPPRSDCVKAILSRLTINTPLFSVSRAAITSGGWPGSLSLFPASNATAGYRLNGAHCLFSRLSCVYLDAPALARNAQARTAAQRFGEGHLTERLHFDNGSSFERLGVAFNQMADNINALIASKNS